MHIDSARIAGKRLLLLSIFSGLYLTLIVSEVLARFDSYAWVGAVRELFTIPAILLQFALFIYAIYHAVSKRKLETYSVIIIAIFLALTSWAILGE
jgi:hypothetical protein